MPESREEFLEQFVEAKKNELRGLRTDYQVPRLMEEEIQSLTEQIAKLQLRLQKVTYRRDNIRELLCTAQRESNDAKTELRTLRSADKIEKLKKLRDQIAELEQKE